MSLRADDTLQSLLQGLDRRGARPALARIGQGIHDEIAYAELAHAARRVAAGLRSRGLGRGDRAVLLAPNSPGWVVTCLAMLELGVVPVPVDSQMSSEDVRHVLDDSRARWVFTTTTNAERLARSGVLAGVRLVYLDEPAGNGEFWKALESDSDASPDVVNAADVAVIFYTSGTSGPPKGVPLTHANIVSNINGLMSLNIVHERDVVLLPLPLHHVYPFVIGVFTPLLMGMSLIVPSSLVGRHFFAALGVGRPSILLGVPRLYEAMLVAVEGRFAARGPFAARMFASLLQTSTKMKRALGINLGRAVFWPIRRRIGPRLRLLISGGSALDPEVALKLEGLGFRLACGYGLTETSPILTFRSAGADGHVGLPLPGVKLRIAAPEAGFEHGEVQASGDNVFAGYLNLPDKTAAAFTADGWFRTGDLGFVDAHGCLHLSGRATSMIVMPGGENVDPEKVERHLERSPLIKEAGVLEHDGALAAVVVPAPSAARDVSAGDFEQSLRADVKRLSRELPSFQRLSDVVVDHAPLPRTRLGKIRRRELSKRYRELLQQDAQAGPTGLAPRSSLAPPDRELLEDPIAARVWDWLGERFEGKAISPDTHMQLDLGVDSLEWLNLTLQIRNRAGVDLADEAIGRIETVRDLLQEAAESKRASELSGGVLELLREPE
ncbi:MAG TPA: AMP-binding protein, partial [Gammaproteobacteria bacterium]|nr:AMP-binding protein [Gammaproteobacteria bacterium]